MREMYIPHPVDLKAGQWRVIRSGVREVDTMVVNVSTGVMDLWFGAFPSPPTGTRPVWRFPSGFPPVTLPASGHDQVIVTIAALRDCQGSVVFAKRIDG